jgi:hypothetical protein
MTWLRSISKSTGSVAETPSAGIFERSLTGKMLTYFSVCSAFSRQRSFKPASQPTFGVNLRGAYLLRSILALAFLILFTPSVYAGLDPIGWRLTGSFPSQTIVNEQYTVTYTFVNNFTRQMPTPLKIAKHPSSSEFTFADHCTNVRLNKNQTCTVVITFFPTSSGQKSVSLDEQYGANVVPLPKLTTTASVSSNPLVTGIVTTDLPPTIGTGEHRPVAFQFINNGNGTVLGPFVYTPNYPADGSFHEQTNTCTAVITLPPGAFCTVTGTLSAKNATTYAVGATLSYTGGSTTVITSTTTASQLVTVTANPVLPANVAAGTDTPTLIGFTYTNTGTQAVFGPWPGPNITAAVNVSPGTGSCADVSDTCSGNPSLAAGASCSKTCNFTTTATGDFTVTGSFNYDGPSVTLQETTNAGRLLTIINNCTQGVGTGSAADVWFSFSGAAVGQACPPTCPLGSTCSGGQCYWTNPSPATGAFHLPSTATATVIIPDLNSSNDIIWQGSFAGRTGCSGTSCATANCNTTGGDTACDPGTSFASPSTKAQITLRRTNADTYLVETINGFTVSTSIGPTTATGPGGQPYVCGTPGSAQAINGEPACSWTFTPPTPPGGTGSYIWTELVTSPTACTTNAQCVVINPNYVCGLSYDPNGSPKINQTCGTQLGYWTANQACIADNVGADTFFNCNTSLTGSLSSYFLLNLYACSPVTGNDFNSCYNVGATTNCCGCHNWNAAPTSLPTPAPPTTQACVNTNPQWEDGTATGEVLGTLFWIKSGCPSAKVYPFDTASSTFTCPAAPVTNNVTSYTLSFCPT